MIKVLFFIKNSKVKLTSEAPIYAKLTLENETTVVSTGKNISLERWENTNKLRLNLRSEKEKVLKQSLGFLKSEQVGKEKLYLNFKLLEVLKVK